MVMGRDLDLDRTLEAFVCEVFGIAKHGDGTKLQPKLELIHRTTFNQEQCCSVYELFLQLTQ